MAAQLLAKAKAWKEAQARLAAAAAPVAESPAPGGDGGDDDNEEEEDAGDHAADEGDA